MASIIKPNKLQAQYEFKEDYRELKTCKMNSVIVTLVIEYKTQQFRIYPDCDSGKMFGFRLCSNPDKTIAILTAMQKAVVFAKEELQNDK